MAGRNKKSGKSAPPRARSKALAPGKAQVAGLKKQLAEARAREGASRAREAATAAILRVIRRSPGDAQPVFDAIAKAAVRLLGGHSAVVTRIEGEVLQLAALTSTSKSGDRAMRAVYPLPVSKAGSHGRVVRLRAPLTVVDTEQARGELSRLKAIGRARGFRSMLVVPMLREGQAIGTMSVSRREPGPFTQPQIGLLQTFADQAVIAIQNARSFNETQEALERQTATAEILKVIASSPAEVQPVFDAIVQTAKRLIGAFSATVTHVGDGMLHLVAHTATTPQGAEALSRFFPIPVEGTPMGRAILSRRPQFVDDFETEPGIEDADRELARSRGFRSVVFVPLMRGDVAIGSLNVTRREAGRMTDHQLDLLKTFADQAVIAIENVRLFNETREALERQTATAEVLGVIASSPANVQPVFDAILRSAVNLCGAEIAAVFPYDGTLVHLGATYNWSKEALAYFSGIYPSPPSPTLMSGRTILGKSIVTLSDAAADEHYDPDSAATGHWRRMVGVPMLREGRPLGALVVCWREPGVTPQRQVDLLQTFADQAVIAIENVRLFNETKEALERQTATAEILKVIASSPSDVQPVFDAIAQSANLLIGGFSTSVTRLFDDSLHLVAYTTTGTSGDEALKGAFPMPLSGPGAATEAIRTKAPVIVRDTETDSRTLHMREVARARGFRSMLFVPLIREGAAMGVISVTRREPGHFGNHQIDLLKTFADQAVIAIENVRLFNETKEALEKQTATADILQVLSGSPSDTQPVFDAIVRHAARLCDSTYANVFRYDGERIHLAASQGGSPEALAALRKSYPKLPDRKRVIGRVIESGRSVHVEDTLADADYDQDFARLLKLRRLLGVPLLRAGRPVGAITVGWAEPGPISTRHEDLLKTFADQAVIAIENVRLFNETKESLERQTATAEILKVIASSPSDVQPVFDSIASSAVRLINGYSAVVMRVEGEMMYVAALTSTSPEGDEALRRSPPFPVSEVRAFKSGSPVIDTDIESDRNALPATREQARKRGWRSRVVVPMLRGREAIGLISITRREPGSFSPHHVELLKTFADQAVIAIENVRLFNETKEALERQTATAEILKVIASSPSDVQPVFDAIVNSAAHLFEPANAAIVMREGNLLQFYGAAGRRMIGADLAEIRKIYPIPFDPERSASARAIVECRAIEILDTEAPEVSDVAKSVARAGKYRSVTTVPLIREGEGIGTIGLTYPEPGFRLNEKQLALVRTFADQAVIAIENVRLFKELQQRTEALTKSVGQLTALGEVGQAISSTLDVETVLKTVVSRAVQLTGLDAGVIYEYEPATGHFELRASQNFDDEGVASLRGADIRKGEGAVGTSVEKREPVQVADTHAPDYPARLRELLDRYGYRALLAVPLLREDNVIGALMMTRKAPGEFAPDVVELLQTFASQSALAIQNARLFREIAEKGRQLQEASQHKSQFLASMSHELRTPLNAILGFNEMIIGQVYGEVPADMQEPLEDIQKSGKHLLRLINNVLDLAKIEAGRMELSLTDYSVHDTVESVRATLRPLAAEKGLEFHASVPADLPLAYGDAGRIAQCLMNLAGNSLKFTKAGKVEIVVAPRDEILVFRVADTGIGIPPDKIAVLFTEFRQTDATIASEYGGTGLGLSISKKFVEMHGGRIWVESEIGKGSTFIFEIPLRVHS